MNKLIPNVKSLRTHHSDPHRGQARLCPEAPLSRIDYRRMVAEILG